MSTKEKFDHIEHSRNMYALAEPREFSFRATSVAEFEDWKRSFSERLKNILGLNNIARDLRGHSPTAEFSESVDKGDYLQEKWYLQVEPTLRLPFWVLRPHNISKPLPLVITPHGHNHPEIYRGEAKTEEDFKSIVQGERDIAVQAVREGYMVISPTTRGFGETRTEEDIREGRHKSCRLQLMHGLLVGRTPIGERVWDMSRLIDWAIDNLPIDKERIAITGNSGGGTVSLFTAACDERISVAVPSCYFCTFEGSIGTITHCDCNYVPGILRLAEMYEVAGLIAPRPLCIVAGLEDKIFPIEHVHEAYQHLKEIYEVAGVSERCELYIGPGGHRYYKAGSWPFIRKWFSFTV
jgi:hypothetical protein